MCFVVVALKTGFTETHDSSSPNHIKTMQKKERCGVYLVAYMVVGGGLLRV
jgi:hypothetical protein